MGSFTDGSRNLLTTVYILTGAGVIVLFARSRWLNRLVMSIIERALDHTTDLEIRDYTRLLGLRGDYHASEITVGEPVLLADGARLPS